MSAKPAFFLALAALLLPLAAYGHTSHISPQALPAPTPSPLIIDDFATGPYALTLNGKNQTKTLFTNAVVPARTAIGGKRGLALTLTVANNPLRQNASIEVAPATATAPAALIFDEGLYANTIPELSYGTLLGPGYAPLKANFSAYDRFRVVFMGMVGGTDLNILAFTGSVYTQWACDLVDTFSPRTVLDFPFANGTPGGGTAGVNFADVSGFFFEFQNYGVYSGEEFGISKIELVPAGTPAGNITCPRIGK